MAGSATTNPLSKGSKGGGKTASVADGGNGRQSTLKGSVAEKGSAMDQPRASDAQGAVMHPNIVVP